MFNQVICRTQSSLEYDAQKQFWQAATFVQDMLCTCFVHSMYIDIETYVLDQEADTYSILCINHSLLNINDIQLMIRGAHT